jgi:predicted nucleic acid binding AN1-type Zn finger protein
VEHRLPEKHDCKGLGELRRFEPVEVEALSKAISEFEAAQKRGKGFLSKLKGKLKRG